MSDFLIELVVRVAVFGTVFGVVAWRADRVRIEPRWALPLVGLVFGVLNAALYWVLAPLVTLASLGTLALATPLLVNAALLYATDRVLAPLRIDGLAMMMWLSLYLTVAHGALWLAFEKIL